MRMKTWRGPAAVWSATIGVAYLFVILCAYPSGTKTKITITFDLIESEVSPVRAEQVSRSTRTYILNADGIIDFDYFGSPTHLRFGETKYIVDEAGLNRSATFHVRRGALVMWS